MFELADPLLLMLLPLPLIVIWLWHRPRNIGAALSVPERVGAELLGAGDAGAGHIRARRDHVLLWFVWALVVLALAGPRDVAPVPALKVSGRDLAFVIDLSGSMVRDDFHLDGEKLTRQEAVIKTGAEFMRRRGGDRVALIFFGSEAYYAAPFSFDVEAVARRIETSVIGISGRATNIADGLGLALKRLRDAEAESRVVILLSDGVNNAGAANPRGVAELARDMGVRVHTIALGPKDLSTAEAGERGVVDAATLAAISQISGGESFRVRNMVDLQQVIDALDRLEATDSDGLAAEIHHEYWIWPAAFAALLCVGLAWRNPV